MGPDGEEGIFITKKYYIFWRKINFHDKNNFIADFIQKCGKVGWAKYRQIGPAQNAANISIHLFRICISNDGYLTKAYTKYCFLQYKR